MKAIFWIGIAGLFLFEIANVFFIMPIPGSQKMNSIDLAYFLYSWRWIFRGVFFAMVIAGLLRSSWKKKWIVFVPIAFLAIVIYMTNFKMAADHMFYPVKSLLLVNAATNIVDSNRLIVGVEINGQAKAYPIQFLGYHHQVMDTVGGEPVLVTYCTVCRSGRVFEPVVNGKQETFRLVGMDHFNAMFEDKTTKSWWRQENGEAIAGKLKGQQLPELFSTQTSLAEWLRLNPSSLIMQPDPEYKNSYDSTLKYETGKSKSRLTGTDSISWNDKSWVVGVIAGKESKAYDWNRLKKERIIHDEIGTMPVLVVIADDDKGFFVFERPSSQSRFLLQDNQLVSGQETFQINGKAINAAASLKPLPAYQEFWHSWRFFHAETKKY